MAGEALDQVLGSWRRGLAGAGVACRALALAADSAGWARDFPGANAALASAWAEQRARHAIGNGPLVRRLGREAGSDLLVSSPMSLPDGGLALLGIVLAPPNHDRLLGGCGRLLGQPGPRVGQEAVRGHGR